MSEGRGALLASNQQLDNTLRDLRNFVAQERERSAGQIDKVEAEKKEISAAIDSETQLAYTTMIGVSAAAITLLIIMSVLIVRTIHVRLQKAVTMAQEVANGDLIKSGPVQGNDEIADLMRAMAAMVDMLSSAVMRIHTSAGAVRHGVSEISTGNAELNERTTEQAASLNETAAAIAQVSTIAGEGATSAESAAGRSATANEAAAQGREIMMQAMRSMNDVQSGAVEIKNIIEVINSIAFQTNILALNAAVEAARAGEQGRGFAVVASEVRSLASKSADAAQEIGRIITRNVEQVETGSALVTEAGEQIDKIATEISETVELIRKISDGSTEQAGAVNEVNETISQLEESTQQNASLAEQISGAADSLVEQAQVLEDAVDVFRVEAG